MKVVFLDFDGVLNSWRYFKDAHTAGRALSVPDQQIDPKAVRWLNEIVVKCGAKVVISSTWRLIYTLPQLRGWLRDAGFVGVVIDKTPSLGDKNPVPRGAEIDAWLREHHEVESFIILDDGQDMAPHIERLILVDARKGLKPRHLIAALELVGPDRAVAT